MTLEPRRTKHTDFASLDDAGTLRHLELADGLELRKESVPIGVLLVIFESRPDVLPQVVIPSLPLWVLLGLWLPVGAHAPPLISPPQVAALAVASGNGLLLKGGKEAAHTNAVLHRVLAAAIEASSGGRVAGAVVGLVEGREAITPLLELDHEIDLVIPRGSNEMVQVVMPLPSHSPPTSPLISPLISSLISPLTSPLTSPLSSLLSSLLSSPISSHLSSRCSRSCARRASRRSATPTASATCSSTRRPSCPRRRS